MSFIAHDVLLECIKKLPPVLEQIAAHDAHVLDQLKRAAKNALLNCAEARRRKGLDRANRFRYSAGEADEAKGCLEIALAWAYADPDPLRELIALYDRALGLLYPNYQ